MRRIEVRKEDAIMMWGYSFGTTGMFMMTLGMIFWTILLVVLAWVIIRWLNHKIPGSSTPKSEASALEILRQRYASGEIDNATYEQMRDRLEHAEVPYHQPTVGSR